MAKFQKLDSKLVDKVVEKVHSHIMPMEMQNSINPMVENSAIFNKSKYVFAF